MNDLENDAKYNGWSSSVSEVRSLRSLYVYVCVHACVFVPHIF